MSRFGQFSLLWVDMAQRLGLNVQVLDEEWGTGVPVEKYAEILAADKSHEIKAVFATHNETATGVTSDVAGVRKALNDAKHPALLFVDGVSVDRLHRFPHGRVGRRLLRLGLAEGLHAADRPRHPRRQQQGARGQQVLEAWSAATSRSRT